MLTLPGLAASGFSYSITGNLATFKNKIAELPDNVVYYGVTVCWTILSDVSYLGVCGRRNLQKLRKGGQLTITGWKKAWDIIRYRCCVSLTDALLWDYDHYVDWCQRSGLYLWLNLQASYKNVDLALSLTQGCTWQECLDS